MSASPEGFGRAAREYELGRPGWPAEVLEGLPLGSGAGVLDLGAARAS